MEVTVRDRHSDVPEGLRRFAIQKVEHLGKYLSTITAIDVELTRDGKPKSDSEYLADLTVATSGPVFRARGSAGDPHAAIDEAVQRLSRQLKEFKRRRSGRPPHSRPKVISTDMKGTGSERGGPSGPIEPSGPESGVQAGEEDRGIR